ncbi:MAG: hypothetical protein N2510_04635 [Ignavibacteria bacterium]|nr:hypothetical protein [Ignavibacteria bacterium]
MQKKKILFICGSLNQTSQLFQISRYLSDDYDCFFTPYYVDTPFLRFLYKQDMLEFTVAGKKLQTRCINFIRERNLKLDIGGVNNNYDLVVTSSDLIIQKNIRGKKIVLVQEGMTDPENIFFYLSKWMGFPRYLASTSTTGLSDAYDVFCVASEAYRELFIKKGADPSKVIVSGIPNFDNFAEYLNNDFPLRGFVLCATSDARETFKYENRKKLIRKVLSIADGSQLVFKLHPNENFIRAEREIKELAPDAMVFREGNTNHMIANCDVLFTTYSSVVFTGLALGKEVYSNFNVDILKKLLPVQNGGISAKNIASLCRKLVEGERVGVDAVQYELLQTVQQENLKLVEAA